MIIYISYLELSVISVILSALLNLLVFLVFVCESIGVSVGVFKHIIDVGSSSYQLYILNIARVHSCIATFLSPPAPHFPLSQSAHAPGESAPDKSSQLVVHPRYFSSSFR